MATRFGPPRTFLGLEATDAAFATVLPIPYDATASYRSGARFGPQAIIDASEQLETYDLELDLEPSRWGIRTLPPLEIDLSEPGAMIERARQAAASLASDGFLLTLGGEHSLTPGLVAGLRETYPDLSVLYLDAHADFREEYQGTPFSHACGLRRIYEMGVPAVLAGVRSLSAEEQRALQEARLPVVPAGYTSLPRNALDVLTQHVYLSIDLDVLDPSIMPAVGNPEPGGLPWEVLLSFLQTVARQRHIVAADLMELAPETGPNYAAYTAAKLAYKLVGYVGRARGFD
jgi:agmatinase